MLLVLLVAANVEATMSNSKQYTKITKTLQLIQESQMRPERPDARATIRCLLERSSGNPSDKQYLAEGPLIPVKCRTRTNQDKNPTSCEARSERKPKNWVCKDSSELLTQTRGAKPQKPKSKNAV